MSHLPTNDYDKQLSTMTFNFKSALYVHSSVLFWAEIPVTLPVHNTSDNEITANGMYICKHTFVAIA